MKRDIQCVRTIEAPYDRVRDHLRDDAASLFGDDGDFPSAHLIAHIRGTKIAREVTIDIVGFDEPDATAVGAHLMFGADASRHADLFPHLEARLDAIPVNDGRTALLLTATYKPPLGIVGGAINALGLHRFAEQAVDNLFDRIARELEG